MGPEWSAFDNEAVFEEARRDTTIGTFQAFSAMVLSARAERDAARAIVEARRGPYERVRLDAQIEALEWAINQAGGAGDGPEVVVAAVHEIEDRIAELREEREKIG